MDPTEDMDEVPRGDVLFAVRFALSRGFKFRPLKRDYTAADFGIWADAILTQLELSGVRFYRKRRRAIAPSVWREVPTKE